MQKFERTPRPTYSPWGSPQDTKEIAPGIWSVSTSSHGGFILSRERVDAMPRELREQNFLGPNSIGYEEDESWHLVVLAFPDEFDAKMRGHAAAVVERRKQRQTEKAWEKAHPHHVTCAMIVKPADFDQDEGVQKWVADEREEGKLTLIGWTDAAGEPRAAIVRGYSYPATREGGLKTAVLPEECEPTGLPTRLLIGWAGDLAGRMKGKAAA